MKYNMQITALLATSTPSCLSDSKNAMLGPLSDAADKLIQAKQCGWDFKFVSSIAAWAALAAITVVAVSAVSAVLAGPLLTKQTAPVMTWYRVVYKLQQHQSRAMLYL